MKCHRCGNVLSCSTAVFCSQCGAVILSGNPTVPVSLHSCGIGWETDQRRNVPLRILFVTIVEILLHPDRFFKEVATKKCPAVPAWIFGLVSGSIGLLTVWFWSMVFGNYRNSPVMAFPLYTCNIPLPWMMIGAPFFITCQLLLSSIYVKIVMETGRHKKAPFTQIFRVICYAESAMSLQIIPFVGALLGSLLGFYDVLAGLRHIYETSRLRIFFRLLLPLLILIGFLTLILIVLIAGALIAGTEILHGWSSLFNWIM